MAQASQLLPRSTEFSSSLGEAGVGSNGSECLAGFYITIRLEANMLILSRKPNQSIRIGAEITVNIVRIRGNTIQLGIDAPKDIHILRSELADKVDASPRAVPDKDKGEGSEMEQNYEPDSDSEPRLLDFSLVF